MDAERAAAAVATTDDGDGQKRCACGVWVPEGSCACPKCLAGRVTTRLRWHFREYPNATAWTLAREIGCAPSLAYRVRDQVLAERRG